MVYHNPGNIVTTVLAKKWTDRKSSFPYPTCTVSQLDACDLICLNINNMAEMAAIASPANTTSYANA